MMKIEIPLKFIKSILTKENLEKLMKGELKAEDLVIELEKDKELNESIEILCNKLNKRLEKLFTKYNIPFSTDIREMFSRANKVIISIITLKIMEIIDKIDNKVLNSLNSVEKYLKEVNAPVKDLRVRYDEHLGFHILANVNCKSSQAIKYWLEILDNVKPEIPVFILWKENDMKAEELGSWIGKILAKMNVHLVTKTPLDVVKLIKEEWN